MRSGAVSVLATVTSQELDQGLAHIMLNKYVQSSEYAACVERAKWVPFPSMLFILYLLYYVTCQEYQINRGRNRNLWSIYLKQTAKSDTLQDIDKPDAI